MEGPSNGGMLYHEVQESKLCAVHCVNTVLQGPFFSEFDLAALASDLDRTERQMMLEGAAAAAASNDFLSEESHNVSLDGDFSIQVLQKALEVWDLQVIPLDCPVAEPAQIDPELENAFICHLQDHWFSIRKVNGEWYNFDSLYAAPEHLSKFYLSAYLDTLKGYGWSIFLVRGNFPKECPISSSEASNGYGQWLSPEDAGRITKSCNSTPAPPRRIDLTRQLSDPFLPSGDAEMLSDMEDEDLKAAIAASLMDSSPAMVSSAPHARQNESQKSKEITANLMGSSPAAASTEAQVPHNENQNSKEITPSLMDPSPTTASTETCTAQNENQNSKEKTVGLMDPSPTTASTEVYTAQNENQNSKETVGLMDSSPAMASAEACVHQNENKNSEEKFV